MLSAHPSLAIQAAPFCQLSLSLFLLEATSWNLINFQASKFYSCGYVDDEASGMKGILVAGGFDSSFSPKGIVSLQSWALSVFFNFFTN